MSKSKRWKKRLLNLGLLAGALILLWFATSPYREARALSLARQAKQVHGRDPVKAIAMLKVAAIIKSTPKITGLLEEWQYTSEIRAHPRGHRAVILAERLAGIRHYSQAEQVLVTAGELNSSGTELLAEIRLGLDKDMPNTQKRLEQAIASDPADIGLHELLRRVYQKLGNQNAASVEADKIKALQTGKLEL